MADPVTVVEEVENARLYSDGTIWIKNVRCSYPHLFRPQSQTNDEGGTTESYAITALLPKDTHDEAKKLIARTIKDILKDKGEKGKPLPMAADKKFLKDGDPKDEDDVGKPENAGMWVLSSRESKKPVLLDRVKDPKTKKLRRLTDADKDKIYGGCFVNILVRPWFQSNKYGKRVNAGISTVQFYMDGEAFGSGRISDDDIDDRFDGDAEESEPEVDPADDL